MKAYMYFQLSGAVSWHEQQSWHSTQLVINVCGSFGSFWPDSKLKMAQLALNRISLQIYSGRPWVKQLPYFCFFVITCQVNLPAGWYYFFPQIILDLKVLLAHCSSYCFYTFNKFTRFHSRHLWC